MPKHYNLHRSEVITVPINELTEKLQELGRDGFYLNQDIEWRGDTAILFICYSETTYNRVNPPAESEVIESFLHKEATDI